MMVKAKLFFEFYEMNSFKLFQLAKKLPFFRPVAM